MAIGDQIVGQMLDEGWELHALVVPEALLGVADLLVRQRHRALLCHVPAPNGLLPMRGLRGRRILAGALTWGGPAASASPGARPIPTRRDRHEQGYRMGRTAAVRGASPP